MDSELNLSLYDQQAAGFDHRAGVMQPAKVAAAITQLYGQLCDQQCKQDSTLIEIGCGTGQIGALLARQFTRYLGIDLSMAMLQQFSPQLIPHQQLLQADGSKSWPVSDNRANVVFSSRAIHWLDIEHTVNEVYRVSSKQQALFIVGRVRRSPDCWLSKLRKHCHQLLKQRQLTARNGDAHLRKLCEAFRLRQAQILPPLVVHQWQKKRSLQQALNDWANKPGLAGTNLSDISKQQVLAELKQWAFASYGDDPPAEIKQEYVLYPIHLLASAAR